MIKGFFLFSSLIISQDLDMDKKLILKISISLTGLLSIIAFKVFVFDSSSTTQILFSDPKKVVKILQPDITSLALKPSHFQWCSEKIGRLDWKNPYLRAKYEKWSDQAIRKKFCNLDIQPLPTELLKKAQFADLAYGFDSAASFVKLEWDKTLKIYRAAGLPFKSNKLDQEMSSLGL